VRCVLTTAVGKKQRTTETVSKNNWHRRRPANQPISKKNGQSNNQSNHPEAAKKKTEKIMSNPRVELSLKADVI